MIINKIIGVLLFISGVASIYHMHTGFDPWAGYGWRHFLIDTISLFLLCFGIILITEG